MKSVMLTTSLEVNKKWRTTQEINFAIKPWRKIDYRLKGCAFDWNLLTNQGLTENTAYLHQHEHEHEHEHEQHRHDLLKRLRREFPRTTAAAWTITEVVKNLLMCVFVPSFQGRALLNSFESKEVL